MEPLVSVVTPVYNSHHHIEQTWESIREQTMTQWEWVIVDDGSTDPSTVSTLDRLLSGDSRVRIVKHATNRGLSCARNSGWRTARAPFVLLLDSDDVLERTAMEKWWLCLVSSSDVAFVKGYIWTFGARETLNDRGYWEGREYLKHNLVSCTSMIRCSVLESAGGFDESMRGGLEDWDFWLRCAALGMWGATMPEYLDGYRVRSSHDDRWPSLTEAGIARYRDSIADRYPRLIDGLQFPDLPRIAPHGSGCRNARSHVFGALANMIPGSWRDAKQRLLVFTAHGTGNELSTYLARSHEEKAVLCVVIVLGYAEADWIHGLSRLGVSVFVPAHLLPLDMRARYMVELIGRFRPTQITCTNDGESLRVARVAKVLNKAQGTCIKPILSRMFALVSAGCMNVLHAQGPIYTQAHRRSSLA